jgi:hypothetical protein
MTNNINESEKERIRKLHKTHSIIKEQDEVGVDINKDFSVDSSSLEPGSKPKAKTTPTFCGELHVFTMCPGGTPFVPTASGIPNGAPCAQISSGSIPFYSMVGSPQPGDIIFVTGYGGAAGGQWCLKYVGVKDQMAGLTHLPLDLNGATIQYIQTYNNCQDCMSQMRDFDCNQDGSVFFCQDVNWGTGQYTGPTAQADCQANCGGPQTENCMCCNGANPVSMSTPVPIGTCNSFNFGASFTNCVPATGPMPICSPPPQEFCVNCNAGWMMPIPQGQQCPQGTVNIGTNPNPPQGGPCWECVNMSICQQTNSGWNFGPNSETTQALCMALPQCGNTNHSCVNNQCQPDPTGNYPNLGACQAVCGQQTFDCVDWTSPSGCQTVNGPGGTFATMDDCLISPCQCDSIVLAWPFYQNNPNNPNGNWDGTPHDGPSNQNALATQLTNVQNSNAYNSTNVTQRHKARCREAAILHW